MTNQPPICLHEMSWNSRKLIILAIAAALLCGGTVFLALKAAHARSGALNSGTPFRFQGNHFKETGLAAFTSNIPIIVLETVWPGPVSVSKSYSRFKMRVYERAEGKPARIDGIPALEMDVGLHVRGMLSRRFPKLSYRLKLQGQDGNARELLGMPADADWVLHGPWLDKSLIRNAFSYDLARAIGVPAMRTRPCEVFLSTSGKPISEADYVGVYYLIEDVERGKDRVALKKLSPDQNTEPEVTGGYLLAWDVGEGKYLPSWKTIQLKYPKQPSVGQRRWLDQAMTAFDQALKGLSYTDPIKGYAAHIEVDAWIDYILFEEFIFNLDGYARSFYLHKDRGGKLRPGPVWDHDLAMGHEFQEGTPFDVWWYEHTAGTHRWIPRLASDPAFQQRLKERWAELRKGVLSNSAFERRIDEVAAPLLAGPAERNFQRWPGLNRRRPLPKPVHYITIQSDTYPEQVEAIKKFLRQRATWMDQNLSAIGKN